MGALDLREEVLVVLLSTAQVVVDSVEGVDTLVVVVLPFRELALHERYGVGVENDDIPQRVDACRRDGHADEVADVVGLREVERVGVALHAVEVLVIDAAADCVGLVRHIGLLVRMVSVGRGAQGHGASPVGLRPLSEAGGRSRPHLEGSPRRPHTRVVRVRSYVSGGKCYRVWRAFSHVIRDRLLAYFAVYGPLDGRVAFPLLPKENRALYGLWRVLRSDVRPEESRGAEMEHVRGGFALESNENAPDPFFTHAMSLPWPVAGPADLLRMLNRTAYVTCPLYYKRVRNCTLSYRRSKNLLQFKSKQIDEPLKRYGH